MRHCSAFLTGRSLLGTFRVKAAALGCRMTTQGHLGQQGTSPAFRQLSKHKGISPSSSGLSWQQFLAGNASCTSTSHRESHSSCRTDPAASPGSTGTRGQDSPQSHLTKRSPKAVISCFILLCLNKKNTKL